MPTEPAKWDTSPLDYWVAFPACSRALSTSSRVPLAADEDSQPGFIGALGLKEVALVCEEHQVACARAAGWTAFRLPSAAGPTGGLEQAGSVVPKPALSFGVIGDGFDPLFLVSDDECAVAQMGPALV
jgi:hypothetical protein